MNRKRENDSLVMRVIDLNKKALRNLDKVLSQSKLNFRKKRYSRSPDIIVQSSPAKAENFIQGKISLNLEMRQKEISRIQQEN